MKETIIFGGGCFWCLEGVFQLIGGVKEVVSGYAGGAVPSPTYDQVCSGNTGHAEVVKIAYDSAIHLEDLLDVFFASHDPTTLNQQGNDIGTQYRSIILYTTEKQKETIQNYIHKLTESGVYDKPIVTEVVPLTEFYPAEAYHQNYYNSHTSQPYCQLIISPKIDKVKEKYQHILK